MFLEKIVASVKDRVDALKAREAVLYDLAKSQGPVKSLAQSLRQHSSMPLGIIAECKQKSPSKGWLTDHYNPVAQAKGYERRGAHGISVLTEPEFFAGHLTHLEQVKQSVSLPVLRKDFVLDPVQIFESRSSGADAVLIIVRIVDDAQLRDLAQAARDVGIEILVEIHAPNELDRAMTIEPDILGVNNRDLDSFETRLTFSLELSSRIPQDVVKISESGIQSSQDVEQIRRHGYTGILVGEHLMRGGNLLEALQSGT
ncbi:indole-3-glycerol phosphate synthase [Sulfobacillus thermosulfidooxidans DSM 9293]|uniref:Indole-3-glycerol phosphate synthase n=1 Tax=Sulfobacillus thermosulfidooxidans (strain DSM 9293 / VKM B-1269 / AT-1) TaxID=929705 RepID=A0A1W1WMF6_SULTA|nr:indole-3-glycerol phosphate synthase TrpC [Sulfobacillus thermosulfidooxidans]SMC07481.1 indole-3-glycerol phosphate synthase [Sulfobacillus thermosulfidooxidans DSM 9293]